MTRIGRVNAKNRHTLNPAHKPIRGEEEIFVTKRCVERHARTAGAGSGRPGSDRRRQAAGDGGDALPARHPAGFRRLSARRRADLRHLRQRVAGGAGAAGQRRSAARGDPGGRADAARPHAENRALPLPFLAATGPRRRAGAGLGAALGAGDQGHPLPGAAPMAGTVRAADHGGRRAVAGHSGRGGDPVGLAAGADAIAPENAGGLFHRGAGRLSVPAVPARHPGAAGRRRQRRSGRRDAGGGAWPRQGGDVRRRRQHDRCHRARRHQPLGWRRRCGWRSATIGRCA